MTAIVKQMMPAAPGMYRFVDDKKTADLIVMWVLAEIHEEPEDPKETFIPITTQIVGLTVSELNMDLSEAIHEANDAVHWSRLGTMTDKEKHSYTVNR